MNFRRTTTLVLMMLGVAASALAQPDWQLLQNDPDPFCNAEIGGVTHIGYSVHESARIVLAVWDEEMSGVLRTVVDAAMPAGFYEVIWDGRDDAAQLLPAGSYPYVLTATVIGGTDVLFTDTKTAHIDCPTPVQPAPWSRIKALYQ